MAMPWPHTSKDVLFEGLVLDSLTGANKSVLQADIPAHGHLRFTEYKSAGSHLKSQVRNYDLFAYFLLVVAPTL